MKESRKMSKRHFEPDADVFPTNHHKPTFVHNEGILDGCEEDRMESFSGGGWTRSRLSIKRPRPDTLKPFDFSLIRGEPIASDSLVPCSVLSKDSDVKLSSPVSVNTSEPASSPAIAVAVPPTRLLPFLFLGSQNDALSKEFMTNYGITHVLNASTSCPKSPFVTDENFLRIPVNDNHNERLLPYFEDVKEFIDGCHKANGRALVHCLAGISRSPTFVIAYVMSHLGLSQDDAYRGGRRRIPGHFLLTPPLVHSTRYVKRRRSSISPNFNFLGQLMEFELMLSTSAHAVHSPVGKDGETFHCVSSTKKLKSKTATNSGTSFGLKVCLASHAQSPTAEFAKLSFDKSGFSADDKSALHGSIVNGKESKLTSGESDALKNDSGSCLTFANEMCPKSAVSNLCSANFRLNEADLNQVTSVNVLDSILGDPVVTAEHCLRTCKTEADERLQKKRTSPPVRPSSISISSLQFDLGLQRQDIPSEIKDLILSDPGICKSAVASFEVLSCVTEACKKLHCSPDLIRQVESVCRSRSINDLPVTVASSALTSNNVVLGDVRPSLMEAAKTSSEACVDRVWHAALDARASNGSLSSVGSGSLHGSRELVQVS